MLWVFGGTHTPASPGVSERLWHKGFISSDRTGGQKPGPESVPARARAQRGCPALIAENGRGSGCVTARSSGVDRAEGPYLTNMTPEATRPSSGRCPRSRSAPGPRSPPSAACLPQRAPHACPQCEPQRAILPSGCRTGAGLQPRLRPALSPGPRFLSEAGGPLCCLLLAGQGAVAGPTGPCPPGADSLSRQTSQALGPEPEKTHALAQNWASWLEDNPTQTHTLMRRDKWLPEQKHVSEEQNISGNSGDTAGRPGLIVGSVTAPT